MVRMQRFFIVLSIFPGIFQARFVVDVWFIVSTIFYSSQRCDDSVSWQFESEVQFN